jgi:hypothetical protein
MSTWILLSLWIYQYQSEATVGVVWCAAIEQYVSAEATFLFIHAIAVKFAEYGVGVLLT